jgi:hypothetical protein
LIIRNFSTALSSDKLTTEKDLCDKETLITPLLGKREAKRPQLEEKWRPNISMFYNLDQSIINEK